MNIFKRIIYRAWQVKNEFFVSIDESQWKSALKLVPENLRPILEKHSKGEKAHLLRVLAEVSVTEGFSQSNKLLYEQLAVLHDIGKTQKRLSLPMKILKVLTGKDPAHHCERGYDILTASGCPRNLAEKVLHHHDKIASDKEMKLFCEIDDRN